MTVAVAPRELVTIHPASFESLYAECYHTAFAGIATVGGAAWPVANTAFFIPFSIPYRLTAMKFFVINSGTVSGNVDVGVYAQDPGGVATATRLISSGSTAQAGVSGQQTFDVPDTPIGPGLFYLAIAMDNTTGTLFRFALGAVLVTAMGLAQVASAFPLPSTVTLVAMANNFVPMVVLTGRVLV